MKKLAASLSWFVITTVLCLAGVLYFSWHYLNLPIVNAALAQERLEKNQVLAQVAAVEIEEETKETSFSASIGARDARATLVANFIERNDRDKSSPLQPYDEWGALFVDIADEYGLDFRLLPAIARKESTFCKSNIARTYYNCYGYGVPSAVTDAGKFTSYEEGARTVAKALKNKYLDKGLTDPIAIMQKYCPPSAGGEGVWARDINQWLAEMRYDDKENSAARATNTDLLEFTP